MKKTFNVGDKVFAKVKGYPAWPAIITQKNKTNYSVLFYGTREVGTCKPQDLYYYLKNREKFTKNQKRAEYCDAVMEIDTAILECGGDGSAENADLSANNLSESFSSTKEDGLRTSTGSKTPAKHKRVSTESRRKSVAKRSRVQTDDEVQQTSENDSMTEPVQDGPNSIYATDKTETKSKLTIADIKVITAEYLQNVIAYGEHVKKSPEIYKKFPVEQRNNKENDLILVRAKTSGKLVGIKYNREIDTTISCEYERAVYDLNEATTMLQMKNLLESGMCDPEEDLALFEVNLDVTENEISEAVELAILENKKQKLEWMKIESRFVQLDTEIKKCLGLINTNCEIAEQLLKDMLNLKIEPLMIMKHPRIFGMAKNLCRYIGNINGPQYNTYEEKKKLDMAAANIRVCAEAVYKKFVNILDYKGDMDPWDYFTGQLARFKNQVRDVIECKVFALTAPPSSRATFFDTLEDQEELTEIVNKLCKSKPATVHLKV